MNDLLKCEVMSNYLREANIVSFINQHIVGPEKKEMTVEENSINQIQKILIRNEEAEETVKNLKENYIKLEEVS